MQEEEFKEHVGRLVREKKSLRMVNEKINKTLVKTSSRMNKKPNAVDSDEEGMPKDSF